MWNFYIGGAFVIIALLVLLSKDPGSGFAAEWLGGIMKIVLGWGCAIIAGILFIVGLVGLL